MSVPGWVITTVRVLLLIDLSDIARNITWGNNATYTYKACDGPPSVFLPTPLDCLIEKTFFPLNF